MELFSDLCLNLSYFSQTSSFEEYDMAKRKGTPILDPMLTEIADVATHPTQAEFAVLGRSGLLQR